MTSTVDVAGRRMSVDQYPYQAMSSCGWCERIPLIDRSLARQTEPLAIRRVLTTGEAEAISDPRVEAALPADLLRDDEIVILLLRPSLLFIPLASLGGLMVILVFTLAVALLAATVAWIPWEEEQAFIGGAGLVAARLGWQTLEWFNRIYVLTDRRILTRAGVLRISVYEAQLRFIQHTTVLRRIRERVCGLGTLGFATAGSDVFDTFWVMVARPFAVHRIVVDAIHRYGDHRKQ